MVCCMPLNDCEMAVLDWHNCMKHASQSISWNEPLSTSGVIYCPLDLDAHPENKIYLSAERSIGQSQSRLSENRVPPLQEWIVPMDDAIQMVITIGIIHPPMNDFCIYDPS